MTDDYVTEGEELLTLLPIIDNFYREQVAIHVNETQRALSRILSHTEYSQYLFKVKEASVYVREKQSWFVCSGMLNRAFRAAPLEGARWGERYDALRGLRRAAAGVAAFRQLEFPETALDHLDLDDAQPFEVQVAHDDLRKSYPHWDRDRQFQTPIDLLSYQWGEFDPPALVDDLEPKRAFFLAMGTFSKGLAEFRTNGLDVIKSFAQSTNARLHMAESPAERGLLLMSNGYMRRAIGVIEGQLDKWTARVEARTARIAFAHHGIHFSRLDPVGQKLYGELAKDLCRSLAGDTEQTHLAHVIADCAEQIETAIAPTGRASAGLGLSLPPPGLR